MKRINVAIVSRARADKVDTIKYLTNFNREDITIFMDGDDSEYRQYRSHNSVKIVRCKNRGITSARNFILDFYKKEELVLMLDDDIEGIFSLGNSRIDILNNLGIYELIKRGFEVMLKNNAYLWGIYPVANHFFMSNKLVNNGFIIGTFCGIRVSNLRYDENIKLKEDYDFTLQNILTFKKVVRFNNYCVKAKHYKNSGGCVDYRNSEVEQEAIGYLKDKYPLFIRDNPKRENEILLKI